MIRLLLSAAILVHQVVAQAQVADAPPLTLEQRTLLRCSAAFAMVAGGQERGEAAMRQWPAMAGQGREFFVRAMAQVMDGAGLDRAQLATALQAEVDEITASGTLAQVMPPCLALLPPQQ